MVEVQDQLRQAGVDDWLVNAVSDMVRGCAKSFDGLLIEVGNPKIHLNTLTTSRTHFVVKNGNGNPRIEDLAKVLSERVIDYCIPRSRIKEAEAVLRETGSSSAFFRLGTEARDLFSRMQRSGEGGELLLYALLEYIIGAPQILCKMALKTNSQMHVHGSDGVHAKFLPNGNLALYWGESKLHANPSSAIDSCFKSIEPFLK